MREIRTIKTMDIQGFGKNHKVCVFFERAFEEDWGYMGMRDYKTYEPTDDFKLSIVPYVNGSAYNVDAGYVNGSYRTNYFDKDMANKIWYNLKNGMDVCELVKALRKLDLILER